MNSRTDIGMHSCWATKSRQAIPPLSRHSTPCCCSCQWLKPAAYCNHEICRVLFHPAVIPCTAASRSCCHAAATTITASSGSHAAASAQYIADSTTCPSAALSIPHKQSETTQSDTLHCHMQPFHHMIHCCRCSNGVLRGLQKRERPALLQQVPQVVQALQDSLKQI